MKSLFSWIMNLIVIALSVFAVLGHFFAPLWTIDLQITLTPEIAEVLFPEPENPTEEEKTTAMLIKELAKENVSLGAKLNFNAAEIINCALTEDENTEVAIKKSIDELVDSVNNEKLRHIEDSIARASVATAVKSQVLKFADVLDKDAETIMTEIGIDDNFIKDNTDAILGALRAEDATVDTVTETVMGVVDSVYDKVETSEFADQINGLSDTDRTAIEDVVKTVVSMIADENGKVDGNDFLSKLFAELLSGDEETGEGSSEETAFVGGADLTYASKKLGANGLIGANFEDINTEPQEKDLKEVLREKLYGIVSDGVVGLFKNVFRVVSIMLAFSSFWWIWLIVKILLRTLTKNPYIKLKSAIMFGWIPFAILYIIPTALIWLLADPASFIWGWIGGIFPSLKTIISGVAISFSTSAIVSIICTVALFAFGIFYAICRGLYKPDSDKNKN